MFITKLFIECLPQLILTATCVVVNPLLKKLFY